MTKLLLVSALAAGLAVAAVGGQQAAVELNVGDQAPDFSLPGSDGRTHRLSDHRGRAVALAWFPAAFSGG